MEQQAIYEICEQCKNAGFDPKRGIICKLTDEKPNFDTACPNFEMTEQAKIKNQILSKNSNKGKKERPLFVTIWLAFALVVNIGVIIFLWTKFSDYTNVDMYDYNTPGFIDTGTLYLVSFLLLINMIGIILLFRWRKSGFYLLVLVAMIGVILAIGVGSFSALIRTIIAILIWYRILKIKKNGVSTWDNLK